MLRVTRKQVECVIRSLYAGGTLYRAASAGHMSEPTAKKIRDLVAEPLALFRQEGGDLTISRMDELLEPFEFADGEQAAAAKRCARPPKKPDPETESVRQDESARAVAITELQRIAVELEAELSAVRRTVELLKELAHA